VCVCVCVVELVFVEAGLGVFLLSLSENLAAWVLAAFAGTVVCLFERVWSFLFTTDIAVGELLILSKRQRVPHFLGLEIFHALFK